MENLDATVLTTALPTMARDFGVRAPELSVTVTAYLIALAVFVPVSGYMADRFGARNVFRGALLLFMAGSLASALSPGLLTIAAARFVQGMGGAMMVPVGRLVLLRSVPKQDLVGAMAWLLMPGLLGTIAGPPVGGFIVTYLHWRWIFWINLPVGVLGLVLVGRFIANVREPERRPFDARGFVLSAGALGLLMFGLELAGPAGDAGKGWTAMGVGAVLAGLYLRHAQRTAYPILDLSLLRIRTFRLATIGGSLTRVLHGAQPFLLALLLQLGFGLSAAHSGLVTFASAVGTFAMKSLVKPILRRTGFRLGLTIMGALGASSYAMGGFFRPDWPLPLIFSILVIAGFFTSFQFTAYNTVAYDEIEAWRMSAATSLYSTLQQITLSLGVCVAATVLHVTSMQHGDGRPTLPDFSIAFWVVAVVGLSSVAANLRFPSSAGAELSGATRRRPRA